MNVYEEQLIAIQTMLTDSNPIVQMEGYNLLFDLWIKQEDSTKFINQLIPIALEHDNLLKEFENRIHEIDVRDRITDIHLRELYKELSSEITKAFEKDREKNELKKASEEAKMDETDSKQDNSSFVSEFDTNILTKERGIFVVKCLFLPVGLNVICSILIDYFDGFFFGSSWETPNTWVFFISVLFLNILLTDRAGFNNQNISNWTYFKKFHDFKIWIIRSLLVAIMLGILTDMISDYVRGR